MNLSGVFAKGCDFMANPQPTDSHLRMSHAIIEELLMRDFTKRQRSILDLILRLSWGCGKKYAIIPRLKDFELCGVSRTKIKAELEYLTNARVIEWDRYENRFMFCKDYDSWKISIVLNYDRELLNHLIHINVLDATAQNGNLVTETATKFPKQQQSSQKVEGTLFPKKQSEEPLNPLPVRDEEVSIKSIIKSIIYIYDHWNSKKIITHRTLTEKLKGHINACLKEYSAEELCRAVDNFAVVLNGDQYYWTHKWTLAEFLTRGLDKFKDESEPLKNFLKSKSPQRTDKPTPITPREDGLLLEGDES